MPKTNKYLALCAGALLLGACGGGGGETASDEGSPSAPTVEFSSFSVADGTAPKRIAFSWAVDDASNVDEFVLLENADGSSGFTEVARADGSETSLEYELSVHLTDWINAEYMLEARTASDVEIGSSDEVNLTQALSAQATGYLKTPGTNGQDFEFGRVVAVSGDGSTLALSESGTQKVYVYRKSSGTSWGANNTTISDSMPGVEIETGDLFGSSIALSHDGSTLAIGASNEDSDGVGVNSGEEGNNNGSFTGAVYVFVRDGAVYNKQAYIKASNTGNRDRFGYSVALSKAGDLLAVGAIGEESSGASEANDDVPDSGAVYAFQRNGTTWSQKKYLKAANPGLSDRFGWSVSITEGPSFDRYIAVGAPGESSDGEGVDSASQGNDNKPNSGAAYVYVFGGLSGWDLQNEYYIKASNTDSGDKFGQRVALSDSGATLAVSAESEKGNGSNQANNDATDSGAAYVFSYRDGTYEQTAYLKAQNVDSGDKFGSRLSLSGDGLTLAIGTYLEAGSATGINGVADNGIDTSGAVYVFERSGDSWSQKSYVKASNTETEDYFGISVSLSGDGGVLAVGAIGEDSRSDDQDANNGPNSGAVYLY